MRAIVYGTYGSPDVLACAEIATPAPADDEVLLRVRAASVNPYESHLMRGRPYVVRLATGLQRPTSPRLGVDVSGQVEAVGPKVTAFRPGDEVFGGARGALAEYVTTKATSLVAKPAGITFEEAAAVNMAGLTALQAVRDFGRGQPAKHVLINGAAGGVGTFAVQIARALGAEVTGVCSTRNLDLVRALGAGRVVDYTRDDFTTAPHRYDAIVDCIGTHPVRVLARLLTPGGRYVFVGSVHDGPWLGPVARMLRTKALSPFTGGRLVVCQTRANQADRTVLRDLLAAGTIRPVIDRVFRLEETAAALRYLETGHARGKVVVTV